MFCIVMLSALGFWLVVMTWMRGRCRYESPLRPEMDPFEPLWDPHEARGGQTARDVRSKGGLRPEKRFHGLGAVSGKGCRGFPGS